METIELLPQLPAVPYVLTEGERKLIARAERRFSRNKNAVEVLTNFLQRKTDSLDGLTDTELNFLKMAAKDCGVQLSH